MVQHHSAIGTAAWTDLLLSEERPDDLRDAYEIALENGKSWRTRLQASLDRMPDTAQILARLP